MPIDQEFYRDKFEKIGQALKDTKRLIIMMHDNPDPDSLSSALTLAYIVKNKFKVPVFLRFAGMIGRPENRAMIRLLKINIRLLADSDTRRGTDFAYVDMQPRTGNSSVNLTRKPVIIIDHHPPRKQTRADFLDIRPEYGAVATMLTEYLLASGLEITSQIATALSYGIASETQDLGREAGETDIEAFRALFPKSNKKIMAGIAHPKLPRENFIMMNRALHHSKIYKNAIATVLGEVDNPDFVPFIADFMLRLERISWAICLGRYQNRVVVSIRTTASHGHAGRFLRQLIGKRGTAGGHGMIAGGQVPCEMEHESCTHLEEELISLFLKKLGHSEDAQMAPLLVTEPIS